jgi:uncharacterized protein (TIGR02246 family)
MLKSQLLASIWLAMAIGAFAQPPATGAPAVPIRNEQDEKAIRAVLAFAFEDSWNSHEPAKAVTPDKCADDAVFINTTGGWVTGCRVVADLLTPLHAPGGRFHDHTRRHVVEDLRFVRPDVAIAVVRTTDIRIAGVPTPGRETRGLVILSKEGGLWKTTASQNTLIQGTPDGNR